ncbi:PAS domain-containing sensor histidine kinase [Archangium gephyra]|uniref:sensor histidine kinase n=1 Tax=Archangium gephyra TaxID=48 RepID=UPI003B8108CC
MPGSPPPPEGPHDELLFRTFAAAMPHIVWTSAGGGAASEFNPAWHAFTGLPTRLPGDAAWLTVVHPDEVSAAEAAWESARATGGRFELELRLRRADGVYRWHHVQCVPVKHPEGSTRWLGSATDIHERKTQEARFEHVVEVSGIGVWFCDLPLTTVTCNAIYRQLYGLPAEGPVTGEMLYRAMHPEDVPLANEAVRRAVEDREPYLLDFRVVIGEGEQALVRWLQATGRVFYDAHGRPERFDGITRDITAQRQLEESLRRTLLEKEESLQTLERLHAKGQSLAAELQAAITSRDTFLSIASHELRTPITSMKMQTQHMRKRIVNDGPAAFSPERVTRLVEQSERSIGRLSRLVEDMLDISRIATGRLNMRFDQVDLSELTRDMVDRFMPQLSEAGHTLELQLSPGLVGRWDRERLEQVLANLLTNVLKYAPGAPLKVRTLKQGASALLEVEDRGPGIAPEDHHRVFERFERLSDASHVSGLGLGLHISKHIVEAHGGMIRVHGAVGQGTRFVVELPLSGPSE